MFDTFQGLPLHVLVLHGAVVAVPLAALLTVLVAVRPRWRSRGAWPVVVLDALVLGLVFVTKESGEALRQRLGATPPIQRHAELGDQLLWFVVALLVVAVLVALVRARSGTVVRGLGVVALVTGLAATVWLVRVGHSGASAVWKDVVTSTNP